MIKRLLFLGLVFVLFTQLCFALDLSVSSEPIKTTVSPLDNAIFAITITNNEAVPVTVDFKYLDVYWTLNPETITLNAGEIKTVNLELISQYENKPEIAEVVISSRDGSFRKVELLRINQIAYNKLLESELIGPGDIDPRKPTILKLRLVNKYDIDLGEITVNLKSEFFEKQETVEIKPFETKTIDFEVTFNEFVEYGNYPVNLKVNYKNKEIDFGDLTLTIGKFGDVKEIKSPESGFLTNQIEITKTNDGNSVMYDTYQRTIGGFEKLFTETTPEPTTITKAEGGYLYTWNIELKPGESKTIFVKTSYLWFFIIIIIIIVVAVLLFYLLKRDITLTKKVVNIKTGKDGATIKIVLSIKNKGPGTLKNIKLYDKVMGVVEEAPHNFGSMQPVISKGFGGYKMVWDIPSLGRSEERIFSYQTTSRLNVVGKSSFPIAIARYVKSGRSLMVKSNKVNLFS